MARSKSTRNTTRVSLWNSIPSVSPSIGMRRSIQPREVQCASIFCQKGQLKRTCMPCSPLTLVLRLGYCYPIARTATGNYTTKHCDGVQSNKPLMSTSPSPIAREHMMGILVNHHQPFSKSCAFHHFTRCPDKMLQLPSFRT
jgi:hypothetical protein